MRTFTIRTPFRMPQRVFSMVMRAPPGADQLVRAAPLARVPKNGVATLPPEGPRESLVDLVPWNVS